ncbi:MAG TPA: alpha-amylase family glycosyl hydrolase [Pyrinomonadaceae bacterium]|nr:alpha-amylase family glycosyl hydrolase [Pyrinomonadaceae bacterium]
MRRPLLILFVVAVFFPAKILAQNDRADKSGLVIYQIWERAYSEKGDFKSITSDLDRLKALGVNMIWLMPVNPIGKVKHKGTIGSPYAVSDYYKINPDYGSAQDLKQLVNKAHSLGIKVIIDVVLNHTAWDNPLIKQHPQFYKRNSQGEIQPPVPEWSDVAGLDYSSKELRSWMIVMLKWWVREFDVDGFRCDVAGMIPTDFWETARAEVSKVKKNTFWLAEAEKSELLQKAFDADYSWKLFHQIDRVIVDGEPAFKLQEVWNQQRSEYPEQSLRLRFIDNHDERRAIARLGEKGALVAAAFIFALDGIPLIYNGMEAGDTTESGAPALFEKRTIFWQFAERRPEFQKFFTKIISLRKNSTALREGRLEWLKNSDPERVVSFIRSGGNEKIVFIANLSNRPYKASIGINGTFEDILSDNAEKEITASSILLNAFEFKILRRIEK